MQRIAKNNVTDDNGRQEEGKLSEKDGKTNNNQHNTTKLEINMNPPKPPGD